MLAVICLTILCLALIALLVFVIIHHSKETADLHLRLASKSLEDYHYWRDEHELELEHNRKVLENSRKNPPEEKTPTAEEIAARGY